VAADRKTKTTKATKRTEIQGSPSPSFKSRPSLQSLKAAPPPPEGFIPPHGGYEHLLSYQKSLVVFDATVYFCNRFVDRRDRTRDQMIQAARSGKQDKVTCYLLDQQLRRLERDFLNEGGLRERMTRARLAARARQGPPGWPKGPK
jgi:four helix bundle suffix protein